MTDLAQGQAVSAGSRSKPVEHPPTAAAAAAGSGRATARAVLDGALRGVALTAVERRFLTRLTQWDKRTATTVAALIARARQGGRREALTGGSANGARGALDAFAYRTSGAASAGCWDCANLSSGLCAEHARDADRAHAFAELAAVCPGGAPHAALHRLDPAADFGSGPRSPRSGAQPACSGPPPPPHASAAPVPPPLRGAEPRGSASICGRWRRGTGRCGRGGSRRRRRRPSGRRAAGPRAGGRTWPASAR